jgi:hypothetical protein
LIKGFPYTAPMKISPSRARHRQGP